MNRDELVFGVAGSTATPAVSITLAQAGLREREHLQEWVLAHPEMLGVDVLVITSEFDRWMSRDGREADRLDVLGLDADGRLVVAELKRDQAPDFVTLQSVKYAAMASRFEVEQLADAYLSFHSQEDEVFWTVMPPSLPVHLAEKVQPRRIWTTGSTSLNSARP